MVFTSSTKDVVKLRKDFESSSRELVFLFMSRFAAGLFGSAASIFCRVVHFGRTVAGTAVSCIFHFFSFLTTTT